MHGIVDLSYIGEVYVQLELAKRGVKTIKTPSGIGFDFLTDNCQRVEVKAALPSANNKNKGGKTYTYTNWQFRITTEPQKSSDFFVCVLFEAIDRPPVAYFVVPKENFKTLNKSGIITFFESDVKGIFKKRNKADNSQYLNAWRRITGIQNGTGTA